MFFVPQRRQCDQRVRVVWRAAINGVNPIPLGLEHLPEVPITPCLRPFIEGSLGIDIVHVAERSNLEPGLFAFLKLTKPDPAHTDTRKVGFAAWGQLALRPQHAAGHKADAGPGTRSHMQETAAGKPGGKGRIVGGGGPGVRLRGQRRSCFQVWHKAD